MSRLPPYPRVRRVSLAALCLAVAAGLTVTPLRAGAKTDSQEDRSARSTVVPIDREVTSVVLDGDRAYILHSSVSAWSFYGDYWVSVYDLSKATSPVLLGTTANSGILFTEHGHLDLAVEGGFAYVVSFAGTRVIDLTDPANPLDASLLPGSSPSSGRIAVAGKRAYVADHDGLHVLDVADPTSPSITGEVALGGEAVSVALGGSFAFVGTLGSRVAVVDVSDPLVPVVVNSVDVPGEAWDIEVRGSHAYLAAGEAGFQVLDVSRPAQPRLLGGLETPAAAHRVAVAGARAYVADGGPGPNDGEPFGLRVIDISNPARPAMLQSISSVNPIARSVQDVSASRDRVAVCGSAPSVADGCIEGLCPLTGYFEVRRASAYGPLPAGAGRARAAAAGDAQLGHAVPAGFTRFALRGNDPNPFRSETSICFDVPRASRVKIRVFDARGRLVRTLVDDVRSAGRHDVRWRGRTDRGEASTAGVYFVVMEAGSFRQTKRITLLK